MSGKIRKYCIVFGCMNSEKSKDLSFFTIPREEERRQQWLKLAQREDLLQKEDLRIKSYLVCSRHFEDSSIKSIKHLKPEAIPTKMLPTTSDNGSPVPYKEVEEPIIKMEIKTEPEEFHRESYDDCPLYEVPIVSGTFDRSIYCDIKQPNTYTVGCQTVISLPPNTKSMKKIKIKTENDPTNSKSDQDNNTIEMPLTPYPEIIFDKNDNVVKKFEKLVKWQNEFEQKMKGKGYAREMKKIALKIFFSSPYAYEILRPVLRLPNKSKLENLKLNIQPLLDMSQLNDLMLKLKSLPANAKYCTICLYETELERSLYYDTRADDVIGCQNINGQKLLLAADSVTVLVLKGIYFNWEQPISYALQCPELARDLTSWIQNVIQRLFDAGLYVKALVSGRESNFNKKSTLVNSITVGRPYFFVETKKIYYIFDVPELFNSVRDILLTRNFQYKAREISWDYIKSLYQQERQNEARMIPKITNAHIDPNGFQKTEVKYTAEVFSYSVYAALDGYIKLGKLTADARETAEFIKTMNDLFDILNSSKVKCPNKLKEAFTMSHQQKLVLEEALNRFGSARVTAGNVLWKTNRGYVKVFRYFQITIQSVMQLFDDLESEGLQYLKTRRLNLEINDTFLKDFVGFKPTTVQFTRSYSQSFLKAMLKKYPSIKYETNVTKILSIAGEIINNTFTEHIQETEQSLVLLHGETDYRMTLPKPNAIQYVASYLLYKCSRKHNCEIMDKILSARTFEEEGIFRNYKKYNKKSEFYGHLKVPSQAFNAYVLKLDRAFEDHFLKYLNKRAGSCMFRLLQKIPTPNGICDCFPREYFLQLFVRLRIYTVLKFNNSEYRKGKQFSIPTLFTIESTSSC